MKKNLKAFRTEADSLGKVELPLNALYGAQTQRAIDNFGFAPRPLPESFIRNLALIKLAAAQANAELGCISDSQAKAITLAAAEVIQGKHSSQFPINVFQTGSGTSTNMNINEVLANLGMKLCTDVSLHPNDDVNYGQSSNDVIPSCIQLSAYLNTHNNLLPALQNLIERLIELAAEYSAVIKTGRTHLMDAMPLSLGDEFKTWAFQISESQQNISASLAALAQLPIGGTAIGTGINTHRNFAASFIQILSKKIGLKVEASKNSASRISAQDATLTLHGHLKVLATILIKVCNDIRWMNSGPNCGLNEIQLKALQPGSSIMPGKVNPVIAEAVIMMSTQVIGNDTAVTLANQSGNFQLNVMLPLIAEKILESIELLSDSANVLANKALNDLTINQDKLAAQAAANPILATALNPLIGYEQASKIAKQAIKSGESLLSVAIRMTDIKPEELEKLLNPASLARPFDE